MSIVPRRTAALGLAVGLLLGVAACSSASSPRPAGQGGSSAAAAGFDSVRQAPAAPMSSVASVADAIRTHADVILGGVGAGFTPNRQRAAVAWLALYLARAHGDPSWLCSTSRDVAGDPTVASATVSFAQHLRTDAYERRYLAQRLTGGTGAAKGAPCLHAHLAAPGVVVGPQSIAPDADGHKLAVTYSGEFAYRLVDDAGHDEPAQGSYRAVYYLSPHGHGWRLAGVGPYYSDVPAGWPANLPLPHDYRGVLSDPAPVRNDPAALTAVRAAVNATGATTSARWRETDRTTITKTGKTTSYTPTVLASFAGGYGQSPSGGERIFRHGLDDLNRLHGHVVDITGLVVPADPTWYNFSPGSVADLPTVQYEGEPIDTSPFVWIALLHDARTAAPTPCPHDLTADRCYQATVDAAKAAYGDSPAAEVGWEFILGGDPTPTLTTGVTAGRIAGLVRGDFPVMYGGTTYQHTRLTARLDYPATPVHRPKRPPASVIAERGTFYVR